MYMICIIGTVITILSYVFLFHYGIKKSRKDSEERWNDIVAHRRNIREWQVLMANEFADGELIYARRSDYHKMEIARIIRFDGIYVFLPYYLVKFENGDEDSINYYSLRKINEVKFSDLK